MTGSGRGIRGLRLRNLAGRVLEKGWYDPTEWGRMKGAQGE